MFGLYIHIPFCNKRCNYCSFASFATSDFDEPNKIFDEYIAWLENEIVNYGKLTNKQAVDTLYFWGWTPHILWKERILNLIEKVYENFDCKNLVELSFECNPYPEDYVLDFVDSIQKQFKKVPRVRFSFGIQSFDDEVLKNSWRPYNFVGMVDFLRHLREYKWDNTVLNFDFIAFGKMNSEWKLRTPIKLKFFEDFVSSHMADSFSVYMLELSKESVWWKLDMKELLEKKQVGDDDGRHEEFEILKNILTRNGYSRYEISNFALTSKSSIHNRIYREMQNYLGLGLSASSFIRSYSDFFGNICENHWVKNDNLKWLRRTNSKSLNEYISDPYNNLYEKTEIKESDFLIEEFFLALRTDLWITDLGKYESILLDNYHDLIGKFEENDLLRYFDNKSWIILTDKWMNLYNTIITDLLKVI